MRYYQIIETYGWDISLLFFSDTLHFVCYQKSLIALIADQSTSQYERVLILSTRGCKTETRPTTALSSSGDSD